MKKTILALGFLLLHSCFYLSCKSSDINTKKNYLISDCLKPLMMEELELLENNIIAIEQFLSQKDCNTEAKAYTKRVIKALKNKTITEVSLACLNKHFDLDQNSPFNLSFGGVFTCENLVKKNKD